MPETSAAGNVPGPVPDAVARATASEASSAAPASAIRAHYAERLRDPATWLRAMRGGVNISKFVRGLRKSAEPVSDVTNPIAADMASKLGDKQRTLLLALRDNTAARYREAFPVPSNRETRVELDSASHSFARLDDQCWLFEQVLRAIKKMSGSSL